MLGVRVQGTGCRVQGLTHLLNPRPLNFKRLKPSDFHQGLALSRRGILKLVGAFSITQGFFLGLPKRDLKGTLKGNPAIPPCLKEPLKGTL